MSQRGSKSDAPTAEQPHDDRFAGGGAGGVPSFVFGALANDARVAGQSAAQTLAAASGLAHGTGPVMSVNLAIDVTVRPSSVDSAIAGAPSVNGFSQAKSIDFDTAWRQCTPCADTRSKVAPRSVDRKMPSSARPDPAQYTLRSGLFVKPNIALGIESTLFQALPPFVVSKTSLPVVWRCRTRTRSGSTGSIAAMKNGPSAARSFASPWNVAPPSSERYNRPRIVP